MNIGKNQIICVVTAVFVLAMAPMAVGRIIFVDDDADGANDGASWADAYNDLQDALTVAQAGDETRVAQGTYRPDRGVGITLGDRTATFQLINGVTLKGGYAGTGTPDPNARDIELYETILTGDLNGDDGPDFAGNGENSYHVVTGGGFQAAIVLDGFTITAGNGNRGGGIYEASGKISNCKITANSATAGGGLNECRAEMTNCIISHNRAIGSGGWISGGGMFNDGTTPTLINCIFLGNSALSNGGGMFSLDNHPTLINCTFSGNSAGGEGGGMLSTECWGTLINCTFSGNTAGENGGGITNHHDCDLTVYNCILWGNTDSGGMDESAQFYAYADRQNIDYCCLQGWTGSLGGTGNIGNDPLFVDANGPDNTAGTEDDNLRLKSGSPCIDTGDPNYVAEPKETDLDGRLRVIGGRIDMGAYEFLRAPQIIYVDDNATEDPGPGDPAVSDPLEDGTQAHPFDAIQEAIDAAYDGDTIIVTEGRYFENINFGGKNITLTSTKPSDPSIVAASIIDGRQAASVVIFELYEDTNCVLDGFTITNGRAKYGGAVRCFNSSPKLKNCVFVDNFAEDHGGAMFNYNSGTKLTNCAFTENSAHGTSGGGGAIQNVSSNVILTNCTFNENQADEAGPAMYNDRSNLTLDNCIFSRHSSYYGGAISNHYSDLILTDCIFTTNSAMDQGGAMRNSYSSLTLNNCAFVGNSANKGGGMFNYESSPRLTNCVFSSNHAGPGTGGAMYNRRSNDLTLTNCTFAQNSGNNGNALACDSYLQQYPSSLVLTNCILWDGGDEIWNNDNSAITITYSDVQGGWTGEGNIDADPLFIEPGYRDANGVWIDGDYRLLPDSLCIDTGDPNYVAEPNETDLDGKPRVIAGRIDMGAYEAPIPAEVRITPSTINLASKGKWITCYIRLGGGYNVTDIDPDSIVIEGGVKAERPRINEEKQVAVVSFNRSEVRDILKIGRVNLTVSGLLSDGTVFEGTDVIIVIDKGSRD